MRVMLDTNVLISIIFIHTTAACIKIEIGKKQGQLHEPSLFH